MVETEQDAARLQEVVEGEAFKGSHRSGQFLTYIVEESIAGRFTALKERVTGVKLFGRDPSYGTGEDAVVRAPASPEAQTIGSPQTPVGPTSPRS